MKTYNDIAEKQFEIHNISKRMDAVDKLSRICGKPTPPWLRSTMIKLYKQMDDVRVHAERNCRKFKTPAAEFSPQVKHCYDRIHAYADLLKLKEGTNIHMNKANVRRRARRSEIENPASLSIKEIQDGLRYCRIRAKDLRKQAKGLRKTHLRNCLIEAQENKDKKRASAVKQKLTGNKT